MYTSLHLSLTKHMYRRTVSVNCYVLIIKQSYSKQWRLKTAYVYTQGQCVCVHAISFNKTMNVILNLGGGFLQIISQNKFSFSFLFFSNPSKIGQIKPKLKPPDDLDNKGQGLTILFPWKAIVWWWYVSIYIALQIGRLESLINLHRMVLLSD